MGDSELFSDLKSDFERSYRGEILVAGSSGVRAQKLWRLAVTMACLSSTETKYCIWDRTPGEKALIIPPSETFGCRSQALLQFQGDRERLTGCRGTVR